MGMSVPRVVALVALALAATPASAQGTGDGFLFKAPAGTLTIRCGFDRASASSDIFSFVTDQLTLNRRDFSAFTFAIDVGVRIGPRVQAVFGLGSSRTSKPSEFRNWVDNNNQPIQQTTDFIRAPITASLKVYLAGPGRSVGRFAWVPARYAPYVGGGAGIMLYRFRQDGDFIDFTTTNVFSDSFNSNGIAPTAQGFVGTEVSLTPRFALTGELRYQWAKAALGKDFPGFNPIDLSGVSATGGLMIR